MENTYYDIEDFLTDESFRSWVVSPTPEIDRYWKTWMEVNPTKVEMANAARAVIQSLRFREFKVNETSKERILDKINFETKPKQKHLALHGTWYKVAAILIFGLGIGALIHFTSLTEYSKEPLLKIADVVKKSNPAGVKSKHILSDGSTIFLNSGSSIEYPKTFNDDTRIVKLKGEAFFQVSKDVNRPFKVVVEDFEVVVLGTEFNVNANLEAPTVALVEGKVLVHSNSSATSVQLTPGLLATHNKKLDSFTTEQFDREYVTGWKDGNLVFKDATFDEVVEKLHAWYGIDISVSNKQKSGDWSYTANFSNESLTSVLTNMSALRDFDYVIKSDSLIISF